MSQIIDYLQTQQQNMTTQLAHWVNHDSPTYNKTAVDAMGHILVQAFREAGATLTTIHRQPERGDHYTLTYGQGDRQILILGHFDTVWPLGEAHKRPFTITNDCATGPGIHDMKSGLLISLYALKAIHQLGLKPRHKLVYLLTSDEEIGSPTSRSLIQAEGRRSNYCLVLEGAVNCGLTVARRGTARFKMQVTGVPAHSGIDPQNGVSAIEELARQIQALHALSDFQRGVMVNVGVISGGERPNIIAHQAAAEIDLRVMTPEDGEIFVDKILNLQPYLPACQLEISGGLTRSPWPESPANVALFEKAKALSEQFELPPVKKQYSGGASDANLVGPLGVPTLDGLGSIGGGAHALSEYTDLTMLPRRAALLAALIMQL